MQNIRMRIDAILNAMRSGIYEKETETALALLAALSGESILLLGPPGVAKSMVARRLKLAFSKSRSFEYLMSRFSTPDELFGPVSIARLKTSDKYERAIDGYLPTADVVFLDEIWKAGPAIQNTLLTVINEKLFRNGDREMKLPLKLLVAASNELPAKEEGLEALWDRFLLRIICRSIEDEHTFRTMLCEDEVTESVTELPDGVAITAEEYGVWQEKARKLSLSAELLQAISYIRRKLQFVKMADIDIPRRIYISDRRWKHVARLLRTSAFIQGRTEAGAEDLLPMYHCLWNEPEEIDEVRRITLQALFAPVEEKLDRLAQAVKADLRACRAQEALNKALREHDHRDDNLFIADRFFFQIENHGTGHTYVFITDFKNMPVRAVGIREAAPRQGLVYTDPQNPQRRIVRMFTPDWKGVLNAEGVEQVTLCRDDNHIYINGVAYRMRQKGSAILSPASGKVGTPESVSMQTGAVSSTHYEDDVEAVCNELDALKARLGKNLFADAKVLKEVEVSVQTYYKQIALTRADIRKLLYNDN